MIAYMRRHTYEQNKTIPYELRVITDKKFNKAGNIVQYTDLTYQVVKGKTEYLYCHNVIVELDAFWLRVIETKIKDAIVVEEQSKTVGPLTTRLSRIKKLADYMYKNTYRIKMMDDVVNFYIDLDSKFVGKRQGNGNGHWASDFILAAEKVLFGSTRRGNDKIKR